MPPLRERGDDVLLIARDFLLRFAKEDGKVFSGFSPDAEQALQNFNWPGNIRQLQNIVRNIVVLSQGPVIDLHDLPRDIQGKHRGAMPINRPSGESLPSEPGTVDDLAARRAGDIEPLELTIQRAIESAVLRCGGSIPRAAAALDVAPSTLYRRIQSYQTVPAARIAS